MDIKSVITRVRRALELDRATGQLRNAPDANALLRREYRAPYVVPEQV